MQAKSTKVQRRRWWASLSKEQQIAYRETKVVERRAKQQIAEFDDALRRTVE